MNRPFGRTYRSFALRLWAGAATLAVAALVAPPPAAAPPAKAAAPTTAAPAREFRADEIADDVSVLAAPGMRGREAGTPEAELAARFVRLRFLLAGLKPGVTRPDGAVDYMQDIPLERTLFNRGGSFLAFRAPGGDASIEDKDELVIDAVGNLTDAPRPMLLVFAGWGISAPEKNHDDYANLDVKGNAVLVWAGEPKTPEGKSAFAPGRLSRYALTETKVAAAQAHGAELVIIAGVPGAPPPDAFQDSADPRHRRLRFTLAGQPPGPALAVLSAEAATRVFTAVGLDLPALLAEAAPGKTVGRPLPKTKATMILRGVHRMPVTERNVVGVVPGSDHALDSAPILVTAHYDHLGYEVGESGKTTIYPGADDNASGVAGMFQIAQALAAGPPLPRTIVFVAFGVEEEGAFGSAYFVAHPAPAGIRPAAVINLDMIGRNAQDDDSNRDVVMAAFTGRCPLFMDLLPTAGKKAGLDVRRIPYINPHGRSDDANFALQDIPALMFFTGAHKDYNQPTDTPENLVPGKAARVAQLALDVVRTLARNTKPLPWDANLDKAPPADPWPRPY